MKCLVNYGTSMYSWIMRKALEWCLKKNYAAIRKIFRLYRNVDLKTQDWKWQHTTKTVVLKARIFKVCFKSCNYVFVFCFISLLINYVFWKEHGGKGNERQTMAAAPGVDWPEGSRKGSLQTAPCHTLPTTPLLPWLPPLPPWLPPPPILPYAGHRPPWLKWVLPVERTGGWGELCSTPSPLPSGTRFGNVLLHLLHNIGGLNL